MIRRTLVSCVAGALAIVFIVTPVAPQAQGGGPIAALQARVQALEDLFAQVNQALNQAVQDLFSLGEDVDALRDEVADLSGGVLASYDDLAGLPCTTALETAGTVNLLGLLKTPICAAGISANGRFLDLGPVIFDAQTNLTWEKKDQAGGLHDVANTYNWCEATGNSTGVCDGNATSWISQVNADVFAGFSNWRVPTKDELLGIADTSVVGCNSGTPCIDPIFGPTQAAVYWSSTVVGPAGAWVVRFNSGDAGNTFKDDGFHVRSVRTGP
jgi:hypothetical protein